MAQNNGLFLSEIGAKDILENQIFSREFSLICENENWFEAYQLFFSLALSDFHKALSGRKVGNPEDLKIRSLKDNIGDFAILFHKPWHIPVCDSEGQIIDYLFVGAEIKKQISDAPKNKQTYIMYDKTHDMYKIGRSVCPKVRESTLQAEAPQIFLVLTCDRDVERILHIEFSAKRVRGEWFRLDADDILKIIEEYKFKSVLG